MNSPDNQLQSIKDNGNNTSLSEQIVIVPTTNNHFFQNFTEARRWAKTHIVGDVNHSSIGIVNISRKAIDKYLSEKAVNKSHNKDVHLAALQVLPDIIRNSIIGEIHADRDKNTNIKDIVRLFGCIDSNGKIWLVKTTVKRYIDSNSKSKAYSYEIIKIKLSEGNSGTTHAKIADFVPTSNSLISIAKILNYRQNSKEEPTINSSD